MSDLGYLYVDDGEDDDDGIVTEFSPGFLLTIIILSALLIGWFIS